MDAPEKPADAGAVNYSIVLTNYTGPDLGALDIGDNLSYGGEPNAVMACWGGIGDTLMIQVANNQPVFLVHGTADAIVPFNTGTTFNLTGISDVYGSNPIYTRLNNLGLTGNQTYFVPGKDHEFYGVNNGNWENGTGGNAYWDTVVSMATHFYWMQNKPTALFSTNETGLDVDFTDESTEAVKWLWHFGDGDTSTAQNPSHTYSTGGNYHAMLYVSNELQSWDTISQMITVSGSVNISNRANPDITIYPNPASDYLIVEAAQRTDNTIFLINSLGQTVKSQSIESFPVIIDLSDVRPGVYTVILNGTTHYTDMLIVE
jgi:PKD repeat protein